MRKTWLKEADIDVSAYFSINSSSELESWNIGSRKISERSYMRGYRDIFSEVSLIHKLLIVFCDKLVRMKIVKIELLGE